MLVLDGSRSRRNSSHKNLHADSSTLRGSPFKLATSADQAAMRTRSCMLINPSVAVPLDDLESSPIPESLITDRFDHQLL